MDRLRLSTKICLSSQNWARISWLALALSVSLLSLAARFHNSQLQGLDTLVESTVHIQMHSLRTFLVELGEQSLNADALEVQPGDQTSANIWVVFSDPGWEAIFQRCLYFLTSQPPPPPRRPPSKKSLKIPRLPSTQPFCHSFFTNCSQLDRVTRMAVLIDASIGILTMLFLNPRFQLTQASNVLPPMLLVSWTFVFHDCQLA